MPLCNRKRMLRQLEAFRLFVSDNDAALYHRYRECLKAINALPDNKHAAYYFVAHASVFRDTLFNEAYNDIKGYLSNNWERGTHHYVYGTHYLQVHIYPEYFDIVFNMMYPLQPPSTERLKQFIAANNRRSK